MPARWPGGRNGDDAQGEGRQAVPGRPPRITLERLLDLPWRPDSKRLWLNWTMHYGQGIVLGVLRAAMARRGLRGPAGSFMSHDAQLLNDQTLENATGVGAPPWTWPKDEQVRSTCCTRGCTPSASAVAADRLLRGPQPSVRSRRNWDNAPSSLPR